MVLFHHSTPVVLSPRWPRSPLLVLLVLSDRVRLCFLFRPHLLEVRVVLWVLYCLLVLFPLHYP